jgi:hypothetical protein
VLEQIEPYLGGKGPPPEVRSFSIHGLSLNLISNSGFMLKAVESLLFYFQRSTVFSDPDVEFHLFETPPEEMHPFEQMRDGGEVLYDSEVEDRMGLARRMGLTVRYLSWKDHYIADFGSWGVLILDLADAAGYGFFPETSALDPAVFSNFIFLIGLSEILRSKELFLIHSGALGKDGKGILVPGFTGSGKTTLTIALVRQGFRFLSDDRPLLRENRPMELLAFPERVDVTEKTASFFPELRDLPVHLFKKGPLKKSFWIETAYPDSIVESCRPEVLIFPRVAERKRSRLIPLSRVEATERVLPHSLLVFERGIAEKQFHFLCRMVERMDCYELRFGQDVLQVHRVIEEAMR